MEMDRWIRRKFIPEFISTGDCQCIEVRNLPFSSSYIYINKNNKISKKWWNERKQNYEEKKHLRNEQDLFSAFNRRNKQSNNNNKKLTIKKQQQQQRKIEKKNTLFRSSSWTQYAFSRENQMVKSLWVNNLTENEHKKEKKKKSYIRSTSQQKRKYKNHEKKEKELTNRNEKLKWICKKSLIK